MRQHLVELKEEVRRYPHDSILEGARDLSGLVGTLGDPGRIVAVAPKNWRPRDSSRPERGPRRNGAPDNNDVKCDPRNTPTRLTNSARETGCMPHLRNAREITGRYGRRR